MTEAKISIIVPVLNEAATLKKSLQALQVYRQAGHEVIVVDGGSYDNSVGISLSLADRIVQSKPGRSVQMNEGAHYSRHEHLLFLHADTQLPHQADQLINAALRAPENVWGRFSLKLSSKAFIFRLIETSINWRTFISGIATGDQGIFVTKEMFERVRRYDLIPLMEDVALSKKLLKYAQPRCLPQKVVSSSRRWEDKGVVYTILLMWMLRVAYFLGVEPDKLASQYYKEPLNNQSTT